MNELIKKNLDTLLTAPSCCKELKDTVNAYIAANDAERPVAAEALVNELREDVMTADEVIAFFRSDAAVKHFGAETAAALLKGVEEHKAAGGKYCNCPACAAGAVILENRELL